jgi:hypothetical protein
MTTAQFVGKVAARMLAFERRMSASKQVTDPEQNLIERVAALEKHAHKLGDSYDFHVNYVYEAIEALYRAAPDVGRAEVYEECGALMQIVDGIQHKRYAEHADKNGVLV